MIVCVFDAHSARYPKRAAFSDLNTFENEIASVLGLKGPVFGALAVEQGKPPVLNYRLMDSAETREAFQAALDRK